MPGRIRIEIVHKCIGREIRFHPGDEHRRQNRRITVIGKRDVDFVTSIVFTLNIRRSIYLIVTPVQNGQLGFTHEQHRPSASIMNPVKNTEFVGGRHTIDLQNVRGHGDVDLVPVLLP